jgi:nicotinamide-nucleotide amidase
MVADLVTSIGGSSKYFECGFVTYSNESKTKMVGVRSETLAKYGAVSEQTVREMVEGALKVCSANIALAITGVAGPSGGSAEKPVGTVYFAWKCRDCPTKVSRQQFSGDRAEIRLAAAKFAISELLNF